jgi:hypothetical protein
VPRIPAYAGQVIGLPPDRLAVVRESDAALADRAGVTGIYIDLTGRPDLSPYVAAGLDPIPLEDPPDGFDLSTDEDRAELCADHRAQARAAFRARHGSDARAMTVLTTHDFHYVGDARSMALVPDVIAAAVRAIVPVRPAPSARRPSLRKRRRPQSVAGAARPDSAVGGAAEPTQPPAARPATGTAAVPDAVPVMGVAAALSTGAAPGVAAARADAAPVTARATATVPVVSPDRPPSTTEPSSTTPPLSTTPPSTVAPSTAPPSTDGPPSTAQHSTALPSTTAPSTVAPASTAPSTVAPTAPPPPSTTNPPSTREPPHPVRATASVPVPRSAPPNGEAAPVDVAYYALADSAHQPTGLLVVAMLPGGPQTVRWEAPGARTAGSPTPVSRQRAEEISRQALGFELPAEPKLPELLNG